MLSSWYDSFTNQFHKRNVWQYLEVPEKGCFTDFRIMKVDNEELALERVFSIGGKQVGIMLIFFGKSEVFR